jgi:cell division transport system permease protein
MGLVRSDVPLAGDASARFLPWIIGCMVYLAALALAATMAADRLAERWSTDLVGTFSIQIPPDASTTAAERERLLGDVAAAVAGMDDVASVRVIAEAEKMRLLEPWLGVGGLPEGVRLPDLVVVQMQSGATPDPPAVRARIAGIAAAATIEDHARWQGDMLAFTRSIKLLASVIIGLIAAAAVTTVVFVTKTGLAIHRRVIEIVHLVGARDGYIAKQFLLHAMRLGLIGGIGGVVLAGATLAGLDWLLAGGQTKLLPALGLDFDQWLALAVVPVAAGIVAMVTAHLTVLFALGREL